MYVLLAGEMFKTVFMDVKMQNQFLTSPRWELFFFAGGGASGWGNVKNFFENVLLAGVWEIKTFPSRPRPPRFSFVLQEMLEIRELLKC